MRASIIASLLALGLVTPALAEEDEAARAARWQDLKQSLFGDRPVTEGTDVIALDAPARALDAATVPISISLPDASPVGVSGKVKTIWLLVDGNPSPLAGKFQFGPAGDAHSLKTRVRVDQYTLIHAVAETEDGKLFATSKFVKAAGGCSAPSSKDAQVANSRIGQMRLRFREDSPAEDGVITANLLISHPNNNGMQMDQVSHTYIPPRYIQDIEIHSGDALVVSAETDISLSEDPAITFGLRPEGDGKLRVEVKDSAGADFRREFALPGRS